MAQRRGGRQKSEYGLQLAEKQKIRNEYGLREKQFRNYFRHGKNIEAIYSILESRLDNTVYRAGFAPTRPAARQMVSHGHIVVNGRKVTIPSCQVRTSDMLMVREQSRSKGIYEDYDVRMKKFSAPSWLAVDAAAKTVKINGKPNVGEEVQPFNFQTVIEFYNR